MIEALKAKTYSIMSGFGSSFKALSTAATATNLEKQNCCTSFYASINEIEDGKSSESSSDFLITEKHLLRRKHVFQTPEQSEDFEEFLQRITLISICDLGLTSARLPRESALFRRLKCLDLSGNSITCVENVEFPLIKRLNLARNKLRTFCVAEMPKLELLNLSSNEFELLPILKAPSLTVLEFANQREDLAIPAGCFDYIGKLETLLLSQNNNLKGLQNLQAAR